MDDMERYGDYNEIDEPPRKSPVLMFIKIVAAVLCVSVIGLLAFRIFTFNYYPASMKKLYFNDTLTSFYNQNGGDISVKTQKLRAPYDDADEGNFFCDNLYVIEELGQLQLSLRYNTSFLDKLKTELSLTDEQLAADDLLSFRLWKSGEGTNPAVQVVGKLTYSERDSFTMYRYYKLVFDGIDLTAVGEDKIEWIRLEVFVKGQKDEKKPYSMIAVYENNEAYSTFSEYKISSSEVPK